MNTATNASDDTIKSRLSRMVNDPECIKQQADFIALIVCGVFGLIAILVMCYIATEASYALSNVHVPAKITIEVTRYR